MSLVSVIVPIYNIEKYIRKCVDSIIEQTYHEIEIILVDDGSTDGSIVICDEVAERDQRIRVIHKENGGLSDARNCGIDNAKGEWLMFIDGDDRVHPQMVEKLLALAETYQSDIVACGFQNVTEDGVVIASNVCDAPIHIFENEEIYHQFYRLEVTLAWNKIYRRSLFETIRYPKGHVHEDEFVIHHLAGISKRLVFTEEKLYYYLTRDGSIMSKVNRQRVDDIVYAMENRIHYYGELGLLQLRKNACNELVNSLIMCGYHASGYEKTERDEIVTLVGEYLRKMNSDNLSEDSEKQRRLFLQEPARCYRYRKNKDIRNRIKDKIKRMVKVK